ncbi:hypothetical protein [Vibrio phage BONAISHI]|nr:hypothetical protein [Vibrio phage BONAISHI]
MTDKVIARIKGDKYPSHDTNAEYLKLDEVWVDGDVYECIKDVPASMNIPITNTEHWKELLVTFKGGNTDTSHDVNGEYKAKDFLYIPEGIYECLQDITPNSNIPLTDTTYWKQLQGKPEAARNFDSHDVNTEYKQSDLVWVNGEVYQAQEDIPENSNVALTDTAKWKLLLTAPTATELTYENERLSNWIDEGNETWSHAIEVGDPVVAMTLFGIMVRKERMVSDPAELLRFGDLYIESDKVTIKWPHTPNLTEVYIARAPDEDNPTSMLTIDEAGQLVEDIDLTGGDITFHIKEPATLRRCTASISNTSGFQIEKKGTVLDRCETNHVIGTGYRVNAGAKLRRCRADGGEIAMFIGVNDQDDYVGREDEEIEIIDMEIVGPLDYMTRIYNTFKKVTFRRYRAYGSDSAGIYVNLGYGSGLVEITDSIITGCHSPLYVNDYNRATDVGPKIVSARNIYDSSNHKTVNYGTGALQWMGDSPNIGFVYSFADIFIGGGNAFGVKSGAVALRGPVKGRFYNPTIHIHSGLDTNNPPGCFGIDSDNCDLEIYNAIFTNYQVNTRRRLFEVFGTGNKLKVANSIFWAPDLIGTSVLFTINETDYTVDDVLQDNVYGSPNNFTLGDIIIERLMFKDPRYYNEAENLLVNQEGDEYVYWGRIAQAPNTDHSGFAYKSRSWDPGGTENCAVGAFHRQAGQINTTDYILKR